jgi:hypothetical protein
MANCSYLFLSDIEPVRRDATEVHPMRHISTARHDIPFAFKVLLSGNPKAIHSPRGGAQLAAFLNRIHVPQAQQVIDHTLSFLNKPEHESTFFVLDPVEVFDLTQESHTRQVHKLIDEINNIASTYDYELARLTEHLGPMTLGPGVMPGFIAKLFGAKQRPAMQVPFPEPLYRYEQAGLLNWHDCSE